MQLWPLNKVLLYVLQKKNDVLTFSQVKVAWVGLIFQHLYVYDQSSIFFTYSVCVLVSTSTYGSGSTDFLFSILILTELLTLNAGASWIVYAGHV